MPPLLTLAMKIMPAHLRLLGLVIALVPACDRESMSTSRTPPEPPSIITSKPTSFDESMVKLAQSSSTTFALEDKPARIRKPNTDSPSDGSREVIRRILHQKLHGVPLIKDLPPTDMPDSKMIPNVAKESANRVPGSS